VFFEALLMAILSNSNFIPIKVNNILHTMNCKGFILRAKEHINTLFQGKRLHIPWSKLKLFQCGIAWKIP